MTDDINNNSTFEELCAGYLLQMLNKKEQEQFEQLLVEATDEQKALYQRCKKTSQEQASSDNGGQSPEEKKEQLIAKVHSNIATADKDTDVDADSAEHPNEESNQEHHFSWSALLATISFALLIVSLSLLFYSFNLSSDINDKKQVITEQDTTIAKIKDKLHQKNVMLEILSSPNMEVVQLKGLEVDTSGYGKVFWAPQKQQALLQVTNLPPVPSNKVYQVWLIRDNEPISIDLFSVQDTSDVFIRMEEMISADKESASAFAITLEPKGGKKQPTGDMYLIGDIKEND